MSFNRCKFVVKSTLLVVLMVFVSGIINAQTKNKVWTEPVVVTPDKKGKAPSDAIILFEKSKLNNFISSIDGSEAPWTVKGKKFAVKPGTKNIQTKQKFGDCQLHIEWKTPMKDVRAGKTSQQCGNSGIFIMSTYEIQVLNSYINKTAPLGQAGAYYNNFPPLVNASIKPGKWQVYDIIFKAPKFDGNQELVESGSFTVFHNGVLIQNNIPVTKPTSTYEEKMPLMLQDHGNEVSYRNIWVREL